MLFRECRLQTLHEIFRLNIPTITLEKTFLAVGGIKACVYIMSEKGVKYLVPSGIADINTAMLCNTLHINYEKISIENFITRYLNEENYRNENVFIVPCASTILNVNAVEHMEKLMIGQSELMIDYIDLFESKVYLKFSILEENPYWIDMDILKSLSKVNIWLTDEATSIIKIRKSDIENSQELHSLLIKDDLELLKECTVNFKKFSKESIDDSCTLIQGLGAYELVYNHFHKLFLLLQSEKDPIKKSNFLRYAKFQLKYFHMFIISGSDGYYRNELESTLRTVLNGKSIFNPLQRQSDWLKIAKRWRKFGRELGELLSKEGDVLNTLEYLIRSFRDITEQEVIMMELLEKQMHQVVVKAGLLL